MRILVMGASGSGTTTLGRALSEELGTAFFDTDDYFWLPTSPPFQQRRQVHERHALLLGDLDQVPAAVVSGSVVGWGSAIEDSFTLIVFLTLAPGIRVQRLREREMARFGYVDEAFIEWAAQYDEGRLEGRSRSRHEAWLAERQAPILRIDGDLTVRDRLERVLEALCRTPKD
ncbi:MAG: AAA family ATPase [Bacteroidetes bacterium]|nr:AAA family ATPase [Bacteroidota bacterium]